MKLYLVDLEVNGVLTNALVEAANEEEAEEKANENRD